MPSPMAASIASRSSVTSISCQTTARPLQSDHQARSTVKFRQFYTRCRNLRILASVNSNDEKATGSNNDSNAPALQLSSINNNFPYHFDSTDPSPLLPKPLSSTQLSKPVSDESRLRVAYQGVRGAYSESAAEKAYPNCEAVPCDQFDAAFQALAQCENTLTRLGLIREAVDDTAGAAKDVAYQNLKDTGAVASSAAAAIYGMNILAEDIQDDCDNVTRFLMLAREPIIPGTDRPFKTSIVFSLEWGAGALFKALAVFALRQINLTKIESRPLRNQPLRSSEKYFDYLFYVDFEASMADQNAQNALRHLKEFATFLRVLGSYPVDTTMI